MKNLVVTMALVMTLGLTAAYAQKSDLDLKKNEIENLLTGITSDNVGLKKSAVYMAGKYEVIETAETLIGQLKVEDDASVKILIALALYRMGSEDGMEAVENLARTDSNKEVKRMSLAILNQWEEDKETVAVK
jgi:HEAT repeat protein